MVHDLTRADYGAKKNPGSYRTIALADRPGAEGHHSVGVYGAATPAAFAKAVNKDHLGRGWTDTFYNTLFWPDGTIIEGRPEHATSGSVTRLTGCLAGNYETRTMPVELKQAVARWRADAVRQGLDASVGWHGQRSSVACPGRNSIPFWRDLPSMSADATPEVYELGGRILRLADPLLRGGDVAEWQQLLDAVGITVTVDGMFGPATGEASSRFMADFMDVATDDPRVGPRTIEVARVQAAKVSEPDAAPREPEFVVAVLASTDVDEGKGRVLAHTHGWKFLRYPEQAADFRIGTAVIVGAAVARAADDPAPRWDDTRLLAGVDRHETALLVARYAQVAGATTRHAPAA